MKKTLKKSCEALALLLILLCISFGLIIEPSLKIHGFAVLDEGKFYNTTHDLTILDDEGNQINHELQPKSVYTSLHEVPKYVQDAFISTEDKRFYNHEGIDFVRIASAIYTNIKSMSYAEGASTISQQLIKNTHLTNDKKISRKLQEMRLAVELERNYTKDEILEVYLNALNFGNNIYGIGNAARVMFDKNISELTIAQGALLAGIINNPSRFNPYTNLEKSKNRRNIVISRMKTNGKITDDEFFSARNEEIELQKLDKNQSDYFYNIVKEASQVLGCSTDEIYTRKLIISTNLDNKIHSQVESLIKEMSLKNDKSLAKAVVLNNLSGNIISLCSLSPFSILNSHRQPGSVIKPFISYVPALESHLIVPTTPILDQKVDFNGFAPSNYKNKYAGWTTARSSLIQSSNVCAVKLMEMNGIEKSINTAKKFGLSFSDNDKSLALALGSMESGMTLNELANAYQVFANDGFFIKSAFIDNIVDENGVVLYERKVSQHAVCSPETAFFMNEMLGECVKSGTAKRLNRHKNLCAKTGTVGDNNGNTDAYCIAYSPEYTVAIWMGSNDYNSRIKPTGGGLPTEYVAKIFDILPKSNYGFNIPSTIIEKEIDTQALIQKHKVVSASDTTLPKNRQKEFFTKTTLPK